MRVTVLGNTAGNDLLERAGAVVRANVRPNPGDLVLIAVSAVEGPMMPELGDALDLADGFQAERMGVLVTEAEQCPDPELVELVGWEIKFILEGKGAVEPGRAEPLPVLLAENPDLGQALERVARAEPPIKLSKPDREPDW